MLDDETIAFYSTQGANLSEGIRKSWRGLTPRALDRGYSAVEAALSTPEGYTGKAADTMPAPGQ